MSNDEFRSLTLHDSTFLVPYSKFIALQTTGYCSNPELEFCVAKFLVPSTFFPVPSSQFLVPVPLPLLALHPQSFYLARLTLH
jgi:hypothetical protein